MRFLFITKEYPPTPDPSGRIVYNIAEELKSQGHHVDVIARDNKSHREDGCLGKIYWIEKTYWEKLSQKIHSGSFCKRDVFTHRFLTYARKVGLAFRLHKFPDSEFSVTKRIMAVYEEYLKTENIDCIIGFFRPYSCLSAAMIIKKKNKQSKCISCYFDLVEPKDRPSLMPKILYNRLLSQGDLRVVSESDCVMLPVSAKKNDNLIFNRCSNVIYYEFPTFVTDNNATKQIERTETSKNVIRLVFAGTMTKAFRSPEIMIELINKVAQQLSGYIIQLDVFGGGDCADMFVSCSRFENLTVDYHGRVSKEEVSLYEEKANFLINIMNAYEAIVPSKIFELFSTGKPILNFITQGDDGSLSYFEKYPLSYTVDWINTDADNKNGIIERLSEFIDTRRNDYISVSDVSELFAQCTPQYVANQIIQACKKGEAE